MEQAGNKRSRLARKPSNNPSPAKKGPHIAAAAEQEPPAKDVLSTIADIDPTSSADPRNAERRGGGGGAGAQGYTATTNVMAASAMSVDAAPAAPPARAASPAPARPRRLRSEILTAGVRLGNMQLSAPAAPPESVPNAASEAVMKTAAPMKIDERAAVPNAASEAVVEAAEPMKLEERAAAAREGVKPAERTPPWAQGVGLDVLFDRCTEPIENSVIVAHVVDVTMLQFLQRESAQLSEEQQQKLASLAARVALENTMIRAVSAFHHSENVSVDGMRDALMMHYHESYAEFNPDSASMDGAAEEALVHPPPSPFFHDEMGAPWQRFAVAVAQLFVRPCARSWNSAMEAFGIFEDTTLC